MAGLPYLLIAVVEPQSIFMRQNVQSPAECPAQMLLALEARARSDFLEANARIFESSASRFEAELFDGFAGRFAGLLSKDASKSARGHSGFFSETFDA